MLTTQINKLQGYLARYVQWRSGPAERYVRFRLGYVSGMALMVLGFWFFINRAPLSYTFLFTILPYWAWGLVCIGVGLSVNLALFFNRGGWYQVGLIAIITLRLFLLWAVLSGTGGVSMVIPEHISWVIVCAWAFLIDQNAMVRIDNDLHELETS